MMTYAAVMR